MKPWQVTQLLLLVRSSPGYHYSSLVWRCHHHPSRTTYPDSVEGQQFRTQAWQSHQSTSASEAGQHVGFVFERESPEVRRLIRSKIFKK